ncbi:MAG TPA: transketolase, partial [Bacilli bacterium]|nr:transketolase [Bacilli bacterium]
IDHYTYVLCSDGDLMEGVAYEAASFAGVQGLNKLIVLYDSNDVTLDAPLKNSFKDNILTRFESMGWNTDYVKEGNDLKEIDKAINRAKKSVNKPTIIEIKTVIGRGTYNEGKSVVHGKPLTKDDTDNLRRNLGITTAPFEIDKKILDYVRQEIANRVQKPYQAWQEYYQKYRNLMDPDIQRNIAFLEKKDIIANFESQNFKIQDNYFEELRESNSKIINLISDRTKFFLGGSADLSSSCKTNLYKELDLTKQNPQGRNIYFGIREHAMGAIINGMALSGLHTYGSTFLSFADYLKPALRMAALMNLPVTYIFTHDTISVGQDGPTHQPIEQLTMLRTTPNLNVYRPADIREVIGCWDIIIKQQKPSALVICKDPLRIISGSDSEQTKQGAYIVSPEEGALQAVIIATGSELTMVNNVKSEIKANYPGLRLVSMPSLELFLKQDATYQQTIIPPQSKVIVVEAGNPLIWCQFTTLSNIIGLQDFGLSGRSEEVKQHFKIDYNSIKERIIGLLK